MLSEKSKNFDETKWPKSEQAKSEQPISKQTKSEKLKFPQITVNSMELFFLFFFEDLVHVRLVLYDFTAQDFQFLQKEEL